MKSIKIDGVTIQRGNSKMGNIMHINLPPPKICSARLCYKTGCYAMKFYKLRKEVKKSWDSNWATLVHDRDIYFKAINAVVQTYSPRLFRWHSAGDIPDVNYWFRMKSLATEHPNTKFMAFTKAYDTLKQARVRGEQYTPANLTVILSGWPGMIVPKELSNTYPTAWMNDPKRPDTNIPNTAIPCSGKCDSCGVCWVLKAGQSVLFEHH